LRGSEGQRFHRRNSKKSEGSPGTVKRSLRKGLNNNRNGKNGELSTKNHPWKKTKGEEKHVVLAGIVIYSTEFWDERGP